MYDNKRLALVFKGGGTFYGIIPTLRKLIFLGLIYSCDYYTMFYCNYKHSRDTKLFS